MEVLSKQAPVSEPTTEPLQLQTEPLFADAVFEGGGVKGIGLVGALAYCEEHGYRWKYVAGTSAGAIVAALVAAGYTALEIKAEIDRFMKEPDRSGKVGYERFKDKGKLDRLPFLGPLLSLVLEMGVYEGNFLERWLHGLLAKKGVFTFADLVDPRHKDDPKSSPHRYRLRVIASDLTRHRMLTFPQDITDFEDFDGDPDMLPVARAVRMSMSIPFFFEPVRLTCHLAKFTRTEKERRIETTSGHLINFSPEERRCYIVDGGVLSNFPVSLFDAPNPARPTFGFRLVSPSDNEPSRITNPLSLFAALFSTMMDAHDQKSLDEDATVRTININTGRVRTTDFEMSSQDSELLYRNGRDGAERFFRKWEAMKGFKGYIEKYRQGSRATAKLG